MKTVIAAFIVALLLTGCPKPLPDGSTPSSIIDCTRDAVRQNALSIIPKVNDALLAADWRTALLALIDPAVGITADVLACVVRSVMSQRAQAIDANPNDAVSLVARDRAATFIVEQGYTFAAE